MATIGALAASRQRSLERIAVGLGISIIPVKGDSDHQHTAILQQIADAVDQVKPPATATSAPVVSRPQPQTARRVK
jgi:hypothetical protein